MRVFEKNGKLSERTVAIIATTVAVCQGRQMRRDRRMEIVAPRQSWFSVWLPWSRNSITADGEDAPKRGFWERFNWTAAVSILDTWRAIARIRELPRG
jgi:hypothetical protein